MSNPALPRGAAFWQQSLYQRWAKITRSVRICNANKRLRLILLDALITTIGAGFTMVAMPFLLIGLSGKALDFGIASFLEAVPALLILLVYPNFLDRFKPLRVLIVCRCLFVLTNLAIAMLIYFDAATTGRLYFMALLSGLVWGISYPATQAILPLYVKKPLIGLANSVQTVTTSTAIAFMPMLAGYLILSGEKQGALVSAFIIDALFVVGSVVLLALLAKSKIVPLTAKKTSADSHISAPRKPLGIGASVDIKTRRAGFVLVFLSLFVVYGPVATYLPIYIVKANNINHFTLYLSQLIGAATAAMVSAKVISEPQNLMKQLHRFWLLAGAALFVFAVTDSLLWHFVVFTVLSFCGCQHGLKVLSWLQSHIPAQQMGKAMMGYSSMVLIAPPLCGMLVGLAVDNFDIHTVVLVNSILVLGCFIVIAIAASAIAAPVSANNLQPTTILDITHKEHKNVY